MPARWQRVEATLAVVMEQHRYISIRALLRENPDHFELLREVFEELLVMRSRAGYPALPPHLDKDARMAAIERAARRGK